VQQQQQQQQRERAIDALRQSLASPASRSRSSVTHYVDSPTGLTRRARHFSLDPRHRYAELRQYAPCKGKGSPYSIVVAERGVPELIPVLGSQPAGDVSHKAGGRLPLLSARPAVTPATLKRAATSFAAW